MHKNVIYTSFIVQRFNGMFIYHWFFECYYVQRIFKSNVPIMFYQLRFWSKELLQKITACRNVVSVRVYLCLCLCVCVCCVVWWGGGGVWTNGGYMANGFSCVWTRNPKQEVVHQICRSERGCVQFKAAGNGGRVNVCQVWKNIAPREAQRTRSSTRYPLSSQNTAALSCSSRLALKTLSGLC